MMRWLAVILLFASFASLGALNIATKSSRRIFLRSGSTVVFFGTFFIAKEGTKAEAAAPTSPAEAIRRGAANIPGFGPSDIFYPSVFEGKWKATRTLLSTSDPTVSRALPDYKVRFLQSIDDQAVVADRGFNQLALEEALGRQVALGTVKWTFTNPNDLQFRYQDGTEKDVKVTKRASERTADTVTSSEFLRVTEQSNQGIPFISARRVLSKWKVIDAGTIEGMEVIYNEGIADPLSGGTSAAPQLIAKSMIRLQRVSTATR